VENSILIYSPKKGARLSYICNIIFKDIFGLTTNVTSDELEFEKANGAKINYSSLPIQGNYIKITPFSLLFEYGIKDHHIEVNSHADYHKIFFKNNTGEVPFDIFSAAFWLLSRYEEYLPFKPDKFNRFDVKNSLAFQYDFIHLPLVNLWLEEFKNLLQKKYPELQFASRDFRYISTIDIDNAYKYKHKGLMRTIGGYVKSTVLRNLSEIKERTSVLLEKEQDPFDSYDFLLETQTKYDLNVIYFFLLGDYGVNDKNHPANNSDFQVLIKHLNDYAEVGIHPSYRSNSSNDQLKIEINRLANITHTPVVRSRQHFSMLTFPDTYQALLQAGITNDHSMGYHNYNGFRSGLCMPYNWYDLDSEQETALVIHPFCIIETTLRYNNKAGISDAVSYAKPIVDQVKKYKGELVSVFHNDTLGTEPEWKDWKKVYEEFVREVVG
jgi:hypothetical protein